MKKILIALLFAPIMAFASGGAVHLDKWPGSVSDKAALQNGAKVFVNYCLNCHGASYMRYKNLLDLGLTEQQVKDNLMFTTDKIGALMTVAARSDEQKQWFGATPPDLTIIARARGEAGNAGAGADWLYTYLRSFYRDENRPTGWNNVVFENVGMPHILYGLQGQQVLNHETHKLELAVPGELAPAAYDKTVSDLVSFMVWMGEPQQEFRRTLGFYVLGFLAVLFVVAYALKKEYWKDIH
ncbi:cytochrome c1 [Quatrionicoccus australiensis]|uniref:cytochrome c1 n=1 Tax=Quatrionicoccus australiensis TaxID=138118 RepID=UPI001CFBAC83|nr:cytochrome c1 [Quatrionicoccus australiensis]MCB4359244.1 cytochrome c1 [Quatrionicoccus australiensis]